MHAGTRSLEKISAAEVPNISLYFVQSNGNKGQGNNNGKN